MSRPNCWMLCVLLAVLLPVGCKEAKQTPAAKELAAKPVKAQPVVPQLKNAASAPAGEPEALAAVLARYGKLEGMVEGTDSHVFGLTMHRMTVRPRADTAVMVRVGEENGLVGAHEMRAVFTDAVAADRIRDGLPALLTAAMGDAGHHVNATALAKQAMSDLKTEGCRAARLGSFQLVATYKPEGMANHHDLSILLGDVRAKMPGTQKLLAMLNTRAHSRACRSIRVEKQ